MKWAAGILAVMLYLAWPYYNLLEFAQAIRAGDTQSINQLVDWSQLRANLKGQLQKRLETRAKTAKEREFDQKNPAFAQFGNTLASSFANAFVDRAVTPEGLVRLIQNARSAQTSHPGVSRQNSLWRHIRFAFFVSPVRFRLDLGDTQRDATKRPPLTVMLKFKGTGWQVYDLRLPTSGDLSSKLALAPK